MKWSGRYDGVTEEVGMIRSGYDQDAFYICIKPSKNQLKIKIKTKIMNQGNKTSRRQMDSSCICFVIATARP